MTEENEQLREESPSNLIWIELEMTGLELAEAELDGRELVGVTVRSEERTGLGLRKAEVAKSLGKTVEEMEGKTNESE